MAKKIKPKVEESPKERPQILQGTYKPIPKFKGGCPNC
jgi:hypothetical protein